MLLQALCICKRTKAISFVSSKAVRGFWGLCRSQRLCSYTEEERESKVIDKDVFESGQTWLVAFGLPVRGVE